VENSRYDIRRQGTVAKAIAIRLELEEISRELRDMEKEIAENKKELEEIRRLLNGTRNV
jgi:predicted DNA-binding antitoxin AbrB/MazE fold protein